MNRFFSILLLGLLLYNMVGYSVVYLTEDRSTISSVAENMVEQSVGSDDIVIKMPVTVPYQNEWSAPRPAEGQIEHQGRFYQMKSQQLLNDTLYVHCESDKNARDRFSDLVSKINDEVSGQTTDSQKAGHATLLKSFLKEYMSVGKKQVFYILEWIPAPTTSFFTADYFYDTLSFSIPSPPPDLA